MKTKQVAKLRMGSALVEVMISVLIVGLVIVPSVGVFTRVASNYNRQAEIDRANLLARSLLAEIMQADFHDPDGVLRVFGLETGESTASRVDFDDVDDFTNLIESPPLLKNGLLVPDSTGYTRATNVKYIKSEFGTIEDSALVSRLKKIAVSVTSPSGYEIVVFGLRAVDGVTDTLPMVESTELDKIDLRLDLGLRTESSSVDVLNKFAQ